MYMTMTYPSVPLPITNRTSLPPSSRRSLRSSADVMRALSVGVMAAGLLLTGCRSTPASRAADAAPVDALGTEPAHAGLAPAAPASAWTSSAARNEVPVAAAPTTVPTATTAATAARPAHPMPLPKDFMDGYYLRTCGLCGVLLGVKGEALDLRHEGRELRVCSETCRGELERDAAVALAKIDAALMTDQRPYYPLKTSLISGAPLGAAPLDFVWGNRRFRVCDASERAQVLADPVKSIRALDRAVISVQTPTYGMPEKCPVQGDILPTDRKIDFVVANRMIRVCCGRCVRIVKARPYQYLGMIEYANRAAVEAAPPDGE